MLVKDIEFLERDQGGSQEEGGLYTADHCRGVLDLGELVVGTTYR